MKKMTEADIKRASGAGVARNMAGMTNAEVAEYCDGQPFGCLAAAAVTAVIVLAAAGCAVYLIAVRRPDLAAAAQPLGWAGWAFGTVAAAAKLFWR